MLVGENREDISFVGFVCVVFFIVHVPTDPNMMRGVDCSKYYYHHLSFIMIIMHKTVIESNYWTLIGDHGPIPRSGS